MKKELLIQAIREDRLMDYISSNYVIFSKEELSAILKEVEYQYYTDMRRAGKKRNLEDLALELEERL